MYFPLEFLGNLGVSEKLRNSKIPCCLVNVIVDKLCYNANMVSSLESTVDVVDPLE